MSFSQSFVERKNIIPKLPSTPDPEKEELESYIDSMSKKYDLSPLLKDQAKIEKLNLKTYEDVEVEKMRAKSEIIKVMNVIRYSAPILEIACKKEKTDEGRSKLFVEINERMMDYAKKTMVLWNISPEDKSNNWILNVLARTYAQSFNEEMMLTEDDIEKLALSVFKVSEETTEERYDRSYLSNMTTSVKVALIKAISPVMNAVYEYSFIKPKQVLEEDMIKIASIVVNRSTFAVAELVKEMADEKDRVMLFKVIAEESGKMFAQVWEKTGKKFNHKYSSVSQEELAILKKNNPNGMEDVLNFCATKFIEQHDIMIKLAKLVD